MHKPEKCYNILCITVKEMVGGSMEIKQFTKKTKIITAIFIVGFCLGIVAIGAYSAKIHPVQAEKQDVKPSITPVPVQAEKQDVKPSSVPESVQTAGTDISQYCFDKYPELLAFKTDDYQDMTVKQFRNKVSDAIDTTEGIQLMEQLYKDEKVSYHRLDNEEAFFLSNTLLLASGIWKKCYLERVGVSCQLANGQTAELEFKAKIELNNPGIKVSEYEAAYHGLAETGLSYLSSKTDDLLVSGAKKAREKISKEAHKEMKKFANSITKKGNITLNVFHCYYDTEGSTSADVKKVLSLKTKGYKDYTLSEFLDYISRQYEEHHSIWEARQSLSINYEMEKSLSKEDYEFLTTTLPCTESESTYTGDRVGNIPPDFSATYELPYPIHATTVLYEWAVQYKVKNADITVGQRDELVLNVKNGMNEFVENTSGAGSKKYLKKMRRHLKKLVSENSRDGLEMTIFKCIGG